MKSVMKHNFSQVPSIQIPRSSFNRSHGYKTTFNSGYLVPFFVDEALPGDTFNLRTSGFCRLATPFFPFMDNVFLDTFYFAIPYRLVWDNFVKMMGEQTDPGDSTDYIVPVMDTSGGATFTEGSLFDYFGVPTNVTGIEVTSLFARAYNLTINTWFRDENLQDSLVVDKDDGPDDIADYVLFRRGKRHDYFTSCLPFLQKGPAVDIPLGDRAPVMGIIKADNTYSAGATTGYASDGTMQTFAANTSMLIGDTLAVAPANQFFVQQQALNPNYPNIYADLTQASAATINSLRMAFQLQALYERDARGGTRYTEHVRAHFGVISPDARLQRPEFLGGGEAQINVHPVATTADVASSSTGDLRAFATAAFQGHGFTKSFTEHTLILGLVNVRADITYQQGLNKMWSRRERLDFYVPALAQIGEQAVLNKEIYCDGSGNDGGVFGYQERFAEYRYKPSIVTGAFRSNAAAPLDAWHLALDFPSLPVLDGTFIQDNPPIDRVVQVTSVPQFIGDFYHDLICARPMPLYGVPASLMRF